MSTDNGLHAAAERAADVAGVVTVAIGAALTLTRPVPSRRSGWATQRAARVGSAWPTSPWARRCSSPLGAGHGWQRGRG